MEEIIEATMGELIRTFTEWDRRYRENPEQFVSEAVLLLKETPESYGDLAGPYFVSVLNDIQGVGHVG